MPRELGSEFERRLAAAAQKLTVVNEEQASQPWREGAWLRKEVLGHLLDSAANNHVRFAFTALNGQYSGPRYEQNEWVRLHDYRGISWRELLDYWRVRNLLLTRVVTQIPEAALESTCRIGENEPVSLRFLITDYLAHLEHHVNQILDGL
jgi:hypothetical protein